MLEGAGQAEAGAREIDNIRAALAWAFLPGGDVAIGVAVAANSAPVWLSLSLLAECRTWMARAAECFDAGGLATRQEMVIQAALGSALMFTGGISGDAYASWTRALRLARKLQDVEHQLIAFLVLWAMQIRRPVYADAAALASQCLNLAEQARDARADRDGELDARRQQAPSRVAWRGPVPSAALHRA
ncbi:MAG: hypothetical protein WDN69_37910 [Aliidongia sp.]